MTPDRTTLHFGKQIMKGGLSSDPALKHGSTDGPSNSKTRRVAEVKGVKGHDYLRSAADDAGDPSDDDHVFGSATGASHLERMNDRVVPVHADANEDEGGQVNAEDPEEGHDSTGGVVGPPRHRDGPSDFQRHQ